MMEAQDDLDEFIAEEAAAHPLFREWMVAFERQEDLIRDLARCREQSGISKARLARELGTSPAYVDRFEAMEADPKLSFMAKYAVAVGKRLSFSLADAPRQREPESQLRTSDEAVRAAVGVDH